MRVPRTPPRPAAVLIHGHPSHRTPPILCHAACGGTVTAAKRWHYGEDVAGMRWNRGENGGGREPKPKPQPHKLNPTLFPAARSLPSLLWPRWLSRFIPQARTTNTYANAHVRRRTCVLSVGTDANARKLRCVGSIRIYKNWNDWVEKGARSFRSIVRCSLLSEEMYIISALELLLK